MGLTVKEAGRSYANREIYQIEWGKGPLKVFLWSQMHGDEPTATSALIDMFAFLQKNRKDWVKKIEDTLTIRAVPMLNPDGAELFQRRNYRASTSIATLSILIARGPAFETARDDWNPAIGFNLHNQGALTTVGSSPFQAAISLLVVYGDEEKTTNPGTNAISASCPRSFRHCKNLSPAVSPVTATNGRPRHLAIIFRRGERRRS